MAKRRRSGGWIAAAVILAIGGYLVADAYDVIPGYLTLEPLPGPPAAFPIPPGAVAAGPTSPVPAGASNITPTSDIDVAQLLEKLTSDRPNMGKSVGAVITDAVTGEVVAQRRPERLMTPASTQKNLVAYAAATQLDLDATLSTVVVQPNSSAIVLVGGGDMMLAADQSDPTAINGRAGLGDLADEVSSRLLLRGDTQVELAYDTSLFDSNTHGVWKQSPAEGYAAPVVPIAVDVGRKSEGEYAPRYNDPAGEAAKIFAQRLEERGIEVTAVRGGAQAADGVTEIGRVESAPLRDIIHHFMVHSDNSITEVVGRLVAIERGFPASFDGATKAVLAALVEAGIDVGDARLVDCSGLAEGSRVSPRMLVEVVTRIATPGDGQFHDIAAGMPVSGWTGTLAARMNGESAIGNVRAKTGSLPKVVALAGTVRTGTGRPLNFAIITDNSPNTWSSRKVIDEFVSELTK
ncbi:D-alanyl-D-alanine carboxypeptidase / D-alanyl-D-alanine-endopeptidase (penicillin-binding protein 4) [Micrococcales bacterium KH10]|nr:D-alanyl-D-alanine carboxypeptidase / D-alanyl-D-alanine-endopeptidase (penicillin-binding protein 4) [Micrococcales bacterium KH10]